MSQTVGDFLVERLHAWGVRKVFGYPGDGIGDFDCSSTNLPSRKTRQRKPTHFGSYCHCLPTGIWSTDSASIGLNGGRSGSAISGLMP
jgi:hypothetical protein